MQFGIVAIPSAREADGFIDRSIDFAQRVERLGFAGLWTTDAFGRGFPTVDPLMLLSTLCDATKTIELGTCVVQVPIRHPVELAHRVQTLNLLSRGRLRLGVGSGSTKDDFDVVGADYEARFKALPGLIDTMQRSWRGEGVNGPSVQVWPGTAGGPPVLLGAWRSPRWIELASKLQGWIASGIHTRWEDLELGLKMYRQAGGTRAVVANIFTDFRSQPELNPMIEHARISLICTPAEARLRLRRLADLGIDDALLVCPFGAPEQLETIRGLI